jgi:RHS repeat-associated protein
LIEKINNATFIQMTKSITVTGTSTHTVNFQYTADNERILKNEKQGTTNNSFLYIRGSNEYPVTEKINTNNTLTEKIYIYGPTGLIAFCECIPSGKDATATYFVIKDHLGSTRLLFKSTGTQYTTYDYSPFGSLMRSSINGDVRYRFTGQEYDFETGLWNFRARLYDDELGIFYAVDPAGQNFSPFSYAGNNPVIFVDKDGRFFWLIPVAIGAIIGGYTGYKIGEAQGASGWGLFAYTFAGAVIGGASGYAGYAVSTSGGIMANTMGLVTSSFSNSVGMSMLSGQNMANINFGLGTYSFGSEKIDWVFGNKNNLGGYLQDISDAFGVISVANDIYALADVGFKETAEAEKQNQQRVTEEGKDITIGDRFTGRNPYNELEENWIEIGDKTNFYEDITTKVYYDKPFLGKWISGANETGLPSIRYGRWHIGVFDIGQGAQTFIHSDYFNINKNLLWHALEWLITPERPAGGR